MKNIEYLELINGYKQALSRKEAVFQAIYLIKKECYESAYVIIKGYELNVGELLSYNISKSEYEMFIHYIRQKNL